MEKYLLSDLLEQMNRDYDRLRDILIALDNAFIIAITDNKGTINYVNDRFCEISKYTATELIGQDHRILNSGYHSKNFFKTLWKTIGSGEVWKGEIKNKSKDGSYYWVQTTIVPFLDEKKKPYQYVSFRLDITEAKRFEELAYYDCVTGLPNRHYLFSHLEVLSSTAKSEFAILFIDIDGFKRVNDLYGHDIGDKFLKEVSDRLINTVRKDDIVARLGGDEFCIVIKDLSERDLAAIASTIVTVFTQPLHVKGIAEIVSPSIGISLYPIDGVRMEDLLKTADTAMYYIKRNGKNNYMFFKDI